MPLQGMKQRRGKVFVFFVCKNNLILAINIIGDLYFVVQLGLYARSQNCEKRLLNSSLFSVCPASPHGTSRFPLDRFL
jgi:hypothetical protein